MTPAWLDRVIEAIVICDKMFEIYVEKKLKYVKYLSNIKKVEI